VSEPLITEVKEEVATKNDLRLLAAELDTKLANLELRMTQRLMETERSLRASIDSTRNLIFGTYALMIAAVFINHLWR
jgi:hypothetical protein